MPLTPSHAAAVLPLARTRLPLSALVVGSMIPDAPLFLQLRNYATTHSVRGVFSWNLAAGLLAYLLWRVVLRRPTLRWLPRSVAVRWPRDGPEARSPVWVSLGVTVGAATHVLWDHFTHGYGYFVHAIPALQGPGPLVSVPLFSLLQLLSSLVGGAVVVVWFANREPATEVDGGAHATPGARPLSASPWRRVLRTLRRPMALPLDELRAWLGWSLLAFCALLVAAVQASRGPYPVHHTITGTGLWLVALWTLAAVVGHATAWRRAAPSLNPAARQPPDLRRPERRSAR